MGFSHNQQKGSLIAFGLVIAAIFTVTVIIDGYSSYRQNQGRNKEIEKIIPLTGSDSDVIKLPPAGSSISTPTENQALMTLPTTVFDPTSTYTPSIPVTVTSTSIAPSQEPTSTDTQTPVNTNTPTATTVPTSTATPAPSNTPTPNPTNTPRPTRTPRPTHTPRPTKTPK